MWFWLLISVYMDLFRRHDVSGWAKAIWVIAILIFPYLGVFAYLITQSRGMAERTNQQAQKARDDLRHIVGFSAADEIEKLDRLKRLERLRIRVLEAARQASAVNVPTCGRKFEEVRYGSSG